MLTGDLGKQGRKMLRLLLEREGFEGLERLQDGGSQIFGEDVYKRQSRNCSTP